MRNAALLLLAGLLAAAALEAQEPLEERVRRLEAALAAKEEQQQTKEEKKGWDFSWKDSFRLVSPDGQLSLKFGGRLQSDWAFYSADDTLEAAVGPFEDGNEFRRARFFFEGELYERIELKAQYDFAGGDSKFRDVYVGLINLPGVGGVRVGHFKEPFSLEELTSSKYITFLERALPIEAFSPSFNAGFRIGRGEERYTANLGAFRDTDEFGESTGSEWNVTGRVTALPVYQSGGDRLLHLGLSVSERSPVDDLARFRSRPESHLAPRLVDTRDFVAGGATIVDLEAAWVSGPFSLQGEYVQASVDSAAGGDPDLSGYYVFGSYFLTRGDRRSYKTSDGAFDRTKPSRDLSHGPGAWEIAVRYSSLDLADAAIAGGELDDLTLALNWYLYSNVRAMLNYVLADRDGIGEVDVVQMRFQVDF